MWTVARSTAYTSLKMTVGKLRDKQILILKTNSYIINPEDCIDCGACEPECPVNAIYPEDDVPDDMQEFIKINYNHFNIEI